LLPEITPPENGPITVVQAELLDMLMLPLKLEPLWAKLAERVPLLPKFLELFQLPCVQLPAIFTELTGAELSPLPQAGKKVRKKTPISNRTNVFRSLFVFKVIL